jgi:serine/threonine protein kinase/regulator of sirC expression with transglutaminase-like and TPR domain
MFERIFRRNKIEVTPVQDLTQGREFVRGELLDQRYQVVNVCRGAMGVVYIAMDRSIEQLVAIKSFQTKYLWNDRAVRYFSDEARVWIRLGSHPHIVRALALREFAGRPHVIAEYVDGCALRAMVGSLDPQQTLDLAIPICWALSYAHERGAILHRDIKPDNVLVTRHGVPKVTDFGLARGMPAYLWSQGREAALAPLRGTDEEIAGGTPRYMAPELFRGTFTAGPWIDIYAFGVMLYELLTGQPPLDVGPGASWAQAHARPLDPDPRRLKPELHKGFSHVVGRCLEREPLKRYGSFAELERDLQHLRRHLVGARLQQSDQHTDSAAQASQLHAEGVAQLSLGQPREALGLFRRANRLQPSEPAYWLDTAQAALALWQADEALSASEEALKQAPDPNTAARLERVRGAALDHLRRTGEALAALGRSLKLNKFDAQTYLVRGEMLERLGRPDEALSDFEAATRYDRLSTQAWRSLGDALRARGDNRRALSAYDTALRLDPRDLSAWRGRGTCLLGLKRYDQATEAFQMVLKLDPDDDSAAQGLRAARR